MTSITITATVRDARTDSALEVDFTLADTDREFVLTVTDPATGSSESDFCMYSADAEVAEEKFERLAGRVLRLFPTSRVRAQGDPIGRASQLLAEATRYQK